MGSLRNFLIVYRRSSCKTLVPSSNPKHKLIALLGKSHPHPHDAEVLSTLQRFAELQKVLAYISDITEVPSCLAKAFFTASYTIPNMALPEAGGAHSAHHGTKSSNTNAASRASSQTWQRRLSKLRLFHNIKPARSTTPLATSSQAQPTISEIGEGKQKWTLSRVRNGIITFGKFIGPGFMVAVAYSESLSSSSPRSFNPPCSLPHTKKPTHTWASIQCDRSIMLYPKA